MADISTIIFTFSTSDGEKKMSFKYANPEVTSATIRTTAAAIIANGSIFEFPPTEVTKAILRTVTEDEFELEG